MQYPLTCDVPVVVGDLSTIIVSAQHGLKIIVIETESIFDGTTAFPGEVLCIAGNDHCGSNARS